MWFRSQIDSPLAPSEQRRRGRAEPTADRSREARRLFLEGLEDRTLLAFNFLADYSTGANPADLTLAQINPGSQPDVVVANNGDTTVGVRLGNAGGSFGTAQNSSSGGSPRSVATGDFTGDGVADVVTATSAGVTLLAGNGDGTFAAPSGISLPDQVAPGNPDPTPLVQNPLSVATGDLNADGKLDLIV